MQISTELKPGSRVLIDSEYPEVKATGTVEEFINQTPSGLRLYKVLSDSPLKRFKVLFLFDDEILPISNQEDFKDESFQEAFI